MRDAAGEVFYGYDARGQRTEAIRRFEDGKERATWTDFDSGGRPVRRGFPDDSYYETHYDARGTTTSVGPFATRVDWNADGELARVEFGSGVIEQREYDNRERLQVLRATTREGGIVRALRIGYDRASLIRSFEDLAPTPSAALNLSARFDYDRRWRLTAMTTEAGVTRYHHDSMANLLAIESPEATLGTTNTFGPNPTSARAELTGPDQLASRAGDAGETTFTYDAAGRMTSDGARQFTWDAKGRLARVQRGGVIEEYIYDHDDRRTIKRTRGADKTATVRYIDHDVEERDGKLVRYISLDEQRIARLDPAPVPDFGATTAPTLTPASTRTLPGSSFPAHILLLWTAFIGSLYLVARNIIARDLVAGISRRFDSPLSRARLRATCAALIVVPAALVIACGGSAGSGDSDTLRGRSKRIDTVPSTTVFYSADHQQTPLALTDATGATISEARTYPYGTPRAHSGAPDPIGYVGNELDVAVGLADFHARPYDARLGIFLAPDPVAVFDPEQLLDSPLSYSAYAYGNRNPVTLSDPRGDTAGMFQSDAITANEQRMLRHADPAVREAGKAHLARKADIASNFIPVPPGGGIATKFLARFGPKIARGLAAAGSTVRKGVGTVVQKGRAAAQQGVAAAKKNIEKVKTAIAPRAGSGAANGAPIVGRSAGAAGNTTITSGIKNSPYATRLAQSLGQQAQRDVDNLVGALSAGNTNPGIGTRALGRGFFELRGANAGRVIIHQGSANQFTIVGKFQAHVRGDTANSAIIQRLIAESGL